MKKCWIFKRYIFPKAFSCEAKKALLCAWQWALPWPWESTDQQWWAEYGKGCRSILQPVVKGQYCFTQQNSEAAASQTYVAQYVLQSRWRKIFTATFPCIMIKLLKVTTVGRTSNYSTVLFSGRNLLLLWRKMNKKPAEFLEDLW